MGYTSRPGLAGMQNPSLIANTRRSVIKQARDNDEPHRFLTNKTKKYAVDGKALPEVDFDAGESYAGLMPISTNSSDDGDLFFWFYPTINKEHMEKKEIVIWLNGGPGCSSLYGALQENGPVLWEIGTKKPIKNPWSWHLLTNVVWVEQPVEVGFSRGKVGNPLEEDHNAEQFLRFWRNFVDTFGLHGWKVYVTAESYGGTYGPYIASHMVDANDTAYYDVGGLVVYNGLIHDSTQIIQRHATVADYVEQRRDYFPLTQQQYGAMKSKAKELGFTGWLCKYLQFPPAAVAPPHPPGVTRADNGSLVIDPEHAAFAYDYVWDPMVQMNPCYNLHQVGALCPSGYDPLGPSPYFNRTDVKNALHVPESRNWRLCDSQYHAEIDPNTVKPAPDQYHLPNVIEHTGNAILVHGMLDIILPLNGVLLGIQNMTWAGRQGFQTAPRDPLYVPLHGFDPFSQAEFYGYERPAGAGVLGTTHTERGLTLVATQLSGHEGPGYSPGSALRVLEKLLGRIGSLSEVSTYTLPELRNITQLKEPLGRGTVHIGKARSGC
ncbi:hypothetical protein PWT90_05814 [Aphanocladium album]|nr:hypothetical protein PWT90_05814 [Aphanocladium album]